MNLFIVCPIYNIPIEKIASLEIFNLFMMKYNWVKLLILDNSDQEVSNINEKECEHNNNSCIKYFNNNGNVGLAKAYNIAIAYIKSLKIEDYYILFTDDDTVFSEEYLENVIHECKLKSSHLYSGIVCMKDTNKLFSPKKSVSLLYNDFISTSGVYQNICCINSGLVVDQYIISRIKCFNESFFVDMIDYWLMFSLKQLHINDFFILEGNIHQKFSGTDYLNTKRVFNRFKIYINDCWTFAKCFPCTIPLLFYLILKRFSNIVIKNISSY